MIKTIIFINKIGKPSSMVLDIIEEEKKFIYCKRLEDNEPVLIARKDIISITDAKIEHKK